MKNTPVTPSQPCPAFNSVSGNRYGANSGRSYPPAKLTVWKPEGLKVASIFRSSEELSNPSRVDHSRTAFPFTAMTSTLTAPVMTLPSEESLQGCPSTPGVTMIG
jgi:hypothetical protein